MPQYMVISFMNVILSATILVFKLKGRSSLLGAVGLL